jgi:hypothetical protein
VAKSLSQQPKSHFPSLKIDQSQFPFYPFRTQVVVGILDVIRGLQPIQRGSKEKEIFALLDIIRITTRISCVKFIHQTRRWHEVRNILVMGLASEYVKGT